MAKGDNSFDVACKVDPQAVTDAVHQATREVQTRYDLKQTKTELGLEKDAITVHTDNDYVLKQILDVLQSKLHRRGVPLKALSYGKVEPAAGGTVRQRIDVQQGIPMEKAREIVRLIKDIEAQGPGSDPGGPGPRLRQEPRRPPGGDQGPPGAGPGHRDAVHELPLGVTRRRPTPSRRQGRPRHRV